MKNIVWVLVCSWVIALFVFCSMLTGCGSSGAFIVPPNTTSPPSYSLEGYYVLPDGGYIDIYDDAQGAYTIRTARLVFRNADGTTALLPISSSGLLFLVGKSLYSNTTVTFVALTNNTKADVGNAQIVGSNLVELVLTKNSVGKLTIRTVVSFNSSLFFDHNITEL